MLLKKQNEINLIGMKQHKLAVQIPEPCHEDWNKMSTTEKGKFCQVCTKEVIDFSAKSDEEIIKLLSNDENVCGRFQISQLNRELIADRKKRNHWLSYAASFLVPMLVFSQGKPKIGKTKLQNQPTYTSLNISSLDRKTENTASQNLKTITGIVLADDGMPLPGATVKIKGTKKGKTTDFDGLITLKVKNDAILLVSFTSYITQEIKVASMENSFKVTLKRDPEKQKEFVVVAMGGITRVTGAVSAINPKDIQTISTKGTLFFHLGQKLSNIFNKKTIKKFVCKDLPTIEAEEIKIQEAQNKAELKKLLQNLKKKH